MPYSYNQLIKECLQKTQNIDLTPIENAISAMQEDLTTLQTLLNSLSKDSNGNYIISIPTKFLDNLTVEGTQTIVKTQEIQSENDYIILREGNPLGLAAGAYSGFKIKNYDGNSNNCLLVVDKDGWARVGDENGTLQKLATIEENPTNGALVTYNTTTKQLESQNVSLSDFVKKFTDSEGAALAVNEIGQYQGVTTAELINGYFYKNIILHNIGDYYLQVAANHSISLYDGTITPDFYTLDIGDYYNDSGATPTVNSLIQNGVFKYSGTNYNVIFVSNDSIHWADVAVGDWILFNNADDNIGAVNIFEWVNKGNFYLAQITNITRDGFGSISEFKIGTSIFTWVSGYGRINTSGDSIPVNINGVQTTVLYNANLNAALILAPMSNGKLAPILIFETIAEVDTPITGLVQTDTQPQPPIASENELGLIKVGLNLAINANGVLNFNLTPQEWSIKIYDTTSNYIRSITPNPNNLYLNFYIQFGNIRYYYAQFVTNYQDIDNYLLFAGFEGKYVGGFFFCQNYNAAISIQGIDNNDFIIPRPNLNKLNTDASDKTSQIGFFTFLTA